MEYRIEKKKSFKVLGKSIKTQNSEGQNNQDIPKFWEEIRNDGSIQKMGKLSANPDTMFGICENADENNNFVYIAGVPYNGGKKENFELFDIPSAEWAIFSAVGRMPLAIQTLWMQIFTEWLPSSGYKLVPLPQLEYYYPGDLSAIDYRSEVWIPVVKK